MPVLLPSASDTINVPLRIDSALDMTEEQFDEYLETLDESLLRYHGEERPTLFKLRRVLPWRLSQKVEDMKLGMEKGEAKPRMAWILEEVRVSLCGIENPANVPADQKIEFKRHSDGGAGEELMSQLQAVGAVMDLWKARQAAQSRKESPNEKK